jgi:hypothetical protein
LGSASFADFFLLWSIFLLYNCLNSFSS